MGLPLARRPARCDVLEALTVVTYRCHRCHHGSPRRLHNVVSRQRPALSVCRCDLPRESQLSMLTDYSQPITGAARSRASCGMRGPPSRRPTQGSQPQNHCLPVVPLRSAVSAISGRTDSTVFCTDCCAHVRTSREEHESAHRHGPLHVQLPASARHYLPAKAITHNGRARPIPSLDLSLFAVLLPSRPCGLDEPSRSHDAAGLAVACSVPTAPELHPSFDQCLLI